MLEVKISEQTEQILRDLAAQNGQDVSEFAGKILEKEVGSTSKNGNQVEDGKKVDENRLVAGERRYLKMKGMFSSGKTDTARRAKEILRAEIGRNGFGDLEK